jgi:hypothetical protein
MRCDSGRDTAGITQQITCTCRCLHFCNLPCRGSESFSLPTGEIRAPPTCLHLWRTNFRFLHHALFSTRSPGTVVTAAQPAGQCLRSTSHVPGQTRAFSNEVQCHQFGTQRGGSVEILRASTIVIQRITCSYRISVATAQLRAVRLGHRPLTRKKLM